MNIHSVLCALAATSAVATVDCQAANLPSTPFAAATGGVWTGDGDDIDPEILLSSSGTVVTAETGSSPGPRGTYRARLGSAGFSSLIPNRVDREVAGATVWSDGLTVTGGAGQGTLRLSSEVEGSMSGSSEMFHALYVSSKPFNIDTILSTARATKGSWQLELPDAVRVLFTGAVNGCGAPGAYRNCGHVPYENHQGALDLTLTAVVPFTFDVPVYVVSIFAGGTIFEGSTNFLNSATFGVTAPPGSALATMSGTVYAAAVPEPSAWLLLVVGLAVVGGSCHRHTPG